MRGRLLLPTRATSSASLGARSSKSITTTIRETNQSAIAYSQSALVSKKTKHIDVKWYFFNDHVGHDGTVWLRYFPTTFDV
jgi:chitodextrinase